MAKNKNGKKKTVMIDYGKINRQRFQNARALGVILMILSVVVFVQHGLSAENLKYIPVFLAGAACTVYGFHGLAQMKKIIEEQNKTSQKNAIK